MRATEATVDRGSPQPGAKTGTRCRVMRFAEVNFVAGQMPGAHFQKESGVKTKKTQHDS